MQLLIPQRKLGERGMLLQVMYVAIRIPAPGSPVRSGDLLPKIIVSNPPLKANATNISSPNPTCTFAILKSTSAKDVERFAEFCRKFTGTTLVIKLFLGWVLNK